MGSTQPVPAAFRVVPGHAVAPARGAYRFGPDRLYLGIVVATLWSLALEGPLRWALNLLSAGIAIYLRDLGAALVVALVAASWLAGDRRASPFVAVLVLLLFHWLVGVLQLGSLFQASFGFKIFLNFLMGFAIAPMLRTRVGSVTRLAAWIFGVTAAGVILNRFLAFPWIGLAYETALGATEGSKQWSTAGTARLPGLSRSSISAATLLAITAVPLLSRPQLWIRRAIVFSVMGFAIVQTTTKGVWTGLAAFVLDAVLSVGLGLSAVANTGLILLALVCIILPVAAVQIRLLHGSVPQVLMSFQDRIESMWPRAFDLIDGPVQWLWGRGLGGIGVPLEHGSDWNRLNAADNLFVFLMVSLGLLSLVYLGAFLYRLASYLSPATRDDPLARWLRGWTAILFGYGLTNNMIEDPAFNIVFGALVGLVFATSAPEARSRTAMRGRRGAYVLTTLLVAGCAGCATSRGPADSAAAEVRAHETAPAERDPPPPAPRLRRLTPEQYQNAVRDLLDIEVDVQALSPVPRLHGLTAIGAATVPFAARDLEIFERLAFQVAQRVFDDARAREAVLGCALSEPACLSDFVRRFGRRAFRRPLHEAEVSRLVRKAIDGAAPSSDPARRARYALSLLLQAPQFLYQVELGEPASDLPGRRRLNGDELASRLAFFLWNTLPDEGLLRAAQAGELDHASGLRAEAERLLASPRSRAAIRGFYAAYLGLDRLKDAQKLPEAFPQAAPSLSQAMREETLRTAYVLTMVEGLDFRALFTTRRTFLNPELAALYGVQAPASQGFAPFQLPRDGPRAGLLGHASLLALNAHAGASSPTLRGKFIRESLLCQSVPAPPPNVNTELPEVDGDTTLRERLRRHREDPACAGCHAFTDEVGLGLSHFDGIGVYRTREAAGAIDASGRLDGVLFDNAVELGRALSQHPDLVSCFVRVLLRHARGVIEHESETAALTRLVAQFARAEHRVPALIVALVQSELFRTLAAPRPTAGGRRS